MKNVRPHGFSLIEILVVVAICAILVGITTPVLVASKNYSYDAQELNALRQMGIASAIYEEQYGSLPLGTQPLVNANLIPAGLCIATRDHTQSGMANEMVSRLMEGSKAYEPLRPAFRSSYIGLYELLYVGDFCDKYVRDQPGAGWLVSLTMSKSDSLVREIRGPWKGTYLRLLFDGSVSHRTHRNLILEDDGHTRTWVPLTMFIDRDPKWIQDSFPK